MQEHSKLYIEEARKKNSQNDIEGAIKAIDTAIQLDAQNIEYYQLRATLLESKKDYQLAAEDLTKIIEISTDIEVRIEAYRKRVGIYEKLGQVDKLMEDLTWLIDHGFGTYGLYAWRGSYNLKLEKSESAIQDFSKVYELSGNKGDLFNRARAYYQSKQYENSLKDIITLLNANDLYPVLLINAYTLRGRILYKMGKYEDALRDFNEERRLNSADGFSDALEYMRVYFPHEV
jgi:tetratricopeptide (TPR) repeat protein